MSRAATAGLQVLLSPNTVASPLPSSASVSSIFEQRRRGFRIAPRPDRAAQEIERQHLGALQHFRRDVLEFQVGDVSGERCGFLGHGVASFVVVFCCHGFGRVPAFSRQHRLRRVRPLLPGLSSAGAGPRENGSARPAERHRRRCRRTGRSRRRSAPSAVWKPSTQAAGNPTSQYPIAANSSGTRVSFMPRSAPAATVWMPSATKKVAPTNSSVAVSSTAALALSSARRRRTARSQTRPSDHRERQRRDAARCRARSRQSPRA